jgi:FkbM family methyltransferase
MILLTNTEIVNLFYDKTIESNPTDFIEVGCFEASASKHLSTQLPTCTVTAYEANPINFKHFNKELKRYNINYINKAISNFNGSTTFYLLSPTKTNIKSSLSKRTKSKKTTPVTVECNTLDHLHNKEDGTYSIWIDAEGHGYEVLEGAINILPKTKYILIEVEKEPWWVDQKLDTDVVKYLESKGFVPIAKDREWSQYNILFENIAHKDTA